MNKRQNPRLEEWRGFLMPLRYYLKSVTALDTILNAELTDSIL